MDITIPVWDNTAKVERRLRLYDNGDGTFSYAGGALATVDFSIPNGQALSAAVDLASKGVLRIVMPAVWTAAVLTFQTSMDGVTFNNIYDEYGTEYTVQAAAGRTIIIDPGKFPGVRFLKIRSGTSGAAVNQAADRTITLVVRPF